MRTTLVMLVALLCSTPTLADQPADEPRPNVLFIFLDDFGWRDAGFMGSDFYETPHLDSLAAKGMVFTNAYAAAANCAPSRASLLSGQYTPRHEIYNVGTKRRGKKTHGRLKHIPGTDTLRPDIKTWAQCAQDAGYRTGTIGKWHLSDDPLPYGFDFNFAGTHGGGPPQGYFPPHGNIKELKDSPKDEYLTRRLTDEAIKFISQEPDQPWFLYLTHFAVHTPLQGEPDLVAKYDSKPKGTLHDHAVMAAMIEAVDQGIGRLIESLDQSGQTDNTVIVFTSDNGGYGPATSMDPLKGYKGTYYEGGIREPMFIVWPGITKPGSTCDVPVINVDLYPTFCEITGAEPPDQVMDGWSLKPLLTGELTNEGVHGFTHRSLYWHFPAYLQSYSRIDGQRDLLFRSRPCSVIRRGRWKLHEYFEDRDLPGGGLELYDLQTDVGESTNLANSNPEVRDRLHKELQQWRRNSHAPVPTEPNPNFDADAERKDIAKLLQKQKQD
ncbi:sulfatase [Rhodopirellula sp. MGV]|uniref:sulfatase n=1 Tax=Rhodopirellula sp. MGV TaxID=2023130 RepID=UPI000B95D88B|nr:sulfatase [Rhodopirellula sp. MGV]OYP37502.1 aryl-sulfate sulfohydrolase [Rhodopirellula sp. MGV]PNY37904.1 aryl-sulfate sulfohydrolase [Rhodopirellula baltica]